MKEKILQLRSEGKSYKEIVNILGCSSGTVAYHCGAGQKQKSIKRQQDNRKESVISSRVDHFQSTKRIRTKSDDFQRERLRGTGKLGERNIKFKWKDVIEKHGWETNCYLTGRKIDLKQPLTYQFDHIVPIGRGGESCLENLGITCQEANQAKANLEIANFLALCQEILLHHGYKVEKPFSR
jgi:5-methylcytosine-specific restriction endonuclease McrA